jgi:hypothetical protein
MLAFGNQGKSYQDSKTLFAEKLAVTPQCYLGFLPVPQLVTIITCGSKMVRNIKLKGLKA